MKELLTRYISTPWPLRRMTLLTREVRKLENEESGGDRYEDINKSRHYSNISRHCSRTRHPENRIIGTGNDSAMEGRIWN